MEILTPIFQSPGDLKTKLSSKTHSEPNCLPKLLVNRTVFKNSPVKPKLLFVCLIVVSPLFGQNANIWGGGVSGLSLEDGEIREGNV